MNEKGAITSDLIGIKIISRPYSEQLYANKLNKTDRWKKSFSQETTDQNIDKIGRRKCIS